MALAQTDVTPGKRFVVVQNPKLKKNMYDMGQPELIVNGYGALPIGTEIEIIEAPNKKYVPSSLTVPIKIVNDPEQNVYPCYWIWFKKRVEEV